ncbi:hypothetical protein HY626_04290 [Candidatus Uhrbacteria bacterium]|nr:hypothetical protein [Candidatus Uhrbacteria bacterium]
MREEQTHELRTQDSRLTTHEDLRESRIVNRESRLRESRVVSRESNARRGMAMLEYVVLVGAILAAVSFAAHIAYRGYVDDAQVIESDGIVF